MSVAVGQCFVKAGASYPDVWQVVSIDRPPGSIAHARLVRLSNPDDRKTLSLVALADRRQYVPHEGNKILRRRLGSL
ncbi:hypothetical protein JL101_006110 [Skermanella rosea]|uniref:hypothetical protein n=1 Tax=Skermanella rosea TaxID=1817965 RepID=UPI0019313869|nr:hypothetical protein [Skermanella rosea]UEM05011.1 hypothetical protein JL101_006110 [Skermanella rosea]